MPQPDFVREATDSIIDLHYLSVDEQHRYLVAKFGKMYHEGRVQTFDEATAIVKDEVEKIVARIRK